MRGICLPINEAEGNDEGPDTWGPRKEADKGQEAKQPEKTG